MSIDTSSMTVSSTTQSSASTSASSTTKTSADSSFKDEMNKVDKSEKKDSKKDVEQKKTDNVDKKDTNQISNSDKKNDVDLVKIENDKLNAELNLQDSLNMTLQNANNMLANDIQAINDLENINRIKTWSFSFGGDNVNSLKMNESDAEFFVNLTKNDNISMQSVTAQAQAMINSGADTSDVSQNFRVSQTLLNALNDARQNSQPLRIDFDRNISVILRVNQNGALSAQFIPGDKVVEQYLKQNIQTLKNTFEENNLPYTDLSYSNSSKEQNKKRREQERQGE